MVFLILKANVNIEIFLKQGLMFQLGFVVLIVANCFFQYIPQGPEVIGYVSADWAWKNIHGQEYTTKVD